MTSEAADAPAADVAPTVVPPVVPVAPAADPAPAGSPARARLSRISADATATPAVQVLRRALTLSWLARVVGVAGLAYGVIYAQSKVGDVGPWEPAIRGAIVLIAVIVASIWLLAEMWAAQERRASRRRQRGQKRR